MVGEFNYFLIVMVLEYIWEKGESYVVYNDVFGVLEGCKFELYWWCIVFYEDFRVIKFRVEDIVVLRCFVFSDFIVRNVVCGRMLS